MAESGVFMQVPLDRIDESPENPRDSLPDLPGMARSIKEHGGIYEPVVLAPKDDKTLEDRDVRFEIIMGHRRCAGAVMAGLSVVPAVIREDLTGSRAAEARLVENLQRADLSPVEQARAFKDLIDSHGYTQTSVARAVGRSQGYISRYLSLLDLPDEAIDLVNRGAMPLAEAYEISRLPRDHALDVLNSIRHGVDLAVAIRAAQDNAERHLERQAAIDTLRLRGVRVLEMDGAPKWDNNRGPYPLEFLPWVDAKAHETGDCHAAVVLSWPDADVDPDEGTVARWAVMCCTNPAAHPAHKIPDLEKLAQAGKKERTGRSKEDRLKAATKKRRQFISDWLETRRFPKTAVSQHLAHQDVISAWLDAPYTPNVEAVSLAAQWMAGDPGAAEELEGKISPERMLRWSVAIRLAVDELAISGEGTFRWSQPAAPLVDTHLRFLEARGYTLTAAEKSMLKDLSHDDSNSPDDDRTPEPA